MPIDVSTLVEVGEFGSKAWCEACAAGGVHCWRKRTFRPISSGVLRGLHPSPAGSWKAGARKRPTTSWSRMARSAVVTARRMNEGASGFHVAIQWASICNQSRTKYGRDGQRQRSEEQQVMFAAIEEYVGRPNPLGLGSRPKAVWPREVAAALGAGAEEGGGLHNIAATLQSPSPEFADLPTTEMGVPDFGAMTDAQKKFFLKLCAVDV